MMAVIDMLTKYLTYPDSGRCVSTRTTCLASKPTKVPRQCSYRYWRCITGAIPWSSQDYQRVPSRVRCSFGHHPARAEQASSQPGRTRHHSANAPMHNELWHCLWKDDVLRVKNCTFILNVWRSTFINCILIKWAHCTWHCMVLGIWDCTEIEWQSSIFGGL